MASPIATAQVSAPGFFGLNTQESPLDLQAGYALVANNCIIDQYGRIGSRKGWSIVNASFDLLLENGDFLLLEDSGVSTSLMATEAGVDALSANSVDVIHELVQADGTLTILVAGNNKLFKLDGLNVLVELTYGGGGVAPTITANNWMCASLNGITYFFQTGHDPLIYDPAVSTTTYRRVSEKVGYAGTVQPANIAISAYGRLWVANTATDKNTLYFSDILAGHIWTGGTAGSLNIDRVWPSGADEITGLAAHNGFLFIFGKRQVLVYANATTPASITLSDTVGSIGCIARDSVQVTSSDLIFLSNSGVRSMMRTIQEKSAPERDLSKNIRNDLQVVIDSENLATIKSVYSEKEGFYLLTAPVAKQVFCFDYKAMLPNGAARATIWNSLEPTALLSRRNGDLLIGKVGYLAKYAGFQDNGDPYRMQYYTNHADLGAVNQTSILKRISAVVVGGSNQIFAFKWGFDFEANYISQNVSIPIQGISEYGIAEYGLSQYSLGVALQNLSVPASGAGKIVQTGYETNISGSPISIQKIEVQYKDGNVI
jgi:hypothetical protein